MTDKIMIYARILHTALYTIRNAQSRNPFVKARDKSSYFEAELAHTLPWNIVGANSCIDSKDIYFLNFNAKYYYDNCNSDLSVAYVAQVESIQKLFALVPPELRKELRWNGP
ncbi:zinc ABC transporter substrate-binding protein [Snodgrassella alvi]|jgi:hypothetical protein|uniref:Zinc ABC transporter substrate-binding protein n=1 Tax=Snodgrassella alvi TaxID=1196083 RepID=A0A855G8L3_9NEIS|nr:zinc ABC transporter substrate-binding protein [Snodgrassella alvi]PIT43997.1 hypothetical protein BHC51_10200 [Snodgrassella alvi]PIT60336.1 hypothetical protein BHC57_04270 [Snodgrassella alvi]